MKQIMGNWKMQGSYQEAITLLTCLKEANLSVPVCFFVPSLWLASLMNTFSSPKIQFGAQDVSAHPEGAFTGEISAKMLADQGVKSVLIGHSERRQYWLESNALIAKKIAQAQRSNLNSVICIGETQAEYDQNKTHEVLSQQLLALKALNLNWSKITLAYEPVWAIGTGLSAQPEAAQDIHHWIKNFIIDNMPGVTQKTVPSVVYGGSVKQSNAKALFEMTDIDGALIGGAAWDLKQLIEICNMAKFL